MTDLTRLAQLAEQHASSYASPHHFVLSVAGLRSIIAALAAQPGAVGERLLRQLLAIRVAGPTLYADDGELQDNSVHPFIDFKRDSASEIERKLIERGMANAWKSIGQFAAAPTEATQHHCPNCGAPAINLFNRVQEGEDLETVHCGCLHQYAAQLPSQPSAAAERENPLADQHRANFEWAHAGWESCKQECDRLRDEIAALSSTPPAQTDLTGWRFVRNSDGSIGIYAPPPEPGKTQRTSGILTRRNFDNWELLGRLADAPPAQAQDAGGAEQAVPVISTEHGPWIPSKYSAEEGEKYCQRCLMRDKFLGAKDCTPHIVYAAPSPSAVQPLSEAQPAEPVRDEPGDPLLDEALRLCVEKGYTSISFVQRRLNIGYQRAGELVATINKRGLFDAARATKDTQ